MAIAMTRQYTTFLVVSGAAALLNLVSRIVISEVVVYEVAVALAFVIAMTFAFLLNSRYVFTSTVGNRRRQYWRFAIVNLIALLQVWGISVGLLRVVFPMIGFHWQAETVAHAIGVASPAVTSYFAHKYYSFRE